MMCTWNFAGALPSLFFMVFRREQCFCCLDCRGAASFVTLASFTDQSCTRTVGSTNDATLVEIFSSFFLYEKQDSF